MDTAILNKIRALLGKAERTDNAHEAEAFSAKAEELLVKYSIDRAVLESLGQEKKQAPIRKDVNIDNPYVTPKATLLNVIAKAHDVQVVLLSKGGSGKQGKCALIGFPSDIELVELLFTSLLLQAVNAVPKESTTSWSGRNTTRSFRASFLAGFANKVGERLRATRQRAESEAVGSALVLRDKKAVVQASFKEQFPRVRSNSVTVGHSNGYAYGQRAGATANIGQTGLGGRRHALV